VAPPNRRRLRTFPFDLMTSRLSGRYLAPDVPFEPNQQPGPCGELVKVIDFDATRGAWYQPVDLDDVAVLARGGLRPVENHPRTRSP
jgi:hypothetical protein